MSEKNSEKLRFWEKLIPAPPLKILSIIFAGIFTGIGITIIIISNAASYMSDDPEVCINCHIMRPQFSTWLHSSHRETATCNDCHVPHDNFLTKYAFKASDGLRHATMFTLRLDPQVIRINEAGKAVVQENCKRCHINQVNIVSAVNVTGDNFSHGEGMLCWGCHRETPHGRVHSQASTPNALVPMWSSPVPEWIQKSVK